MGILDWIFGKHEPRPADPERSAEAAWVPLWKSGLITAELEAHDIDCVVVEDHSSHWTGRSAIPHARIFVMEPDLAEAERIIEEITGYPPAHLDGR